jgi:uncharacterized protein (TIGR02147 family)
MARQMGLAPSLLSDVLSGSRNISLERSMVVSRSLPLTTRERDYFTALVQFETARDPEAKSLILEKINSLRARAPVHDVGLDSFQAISEWYHFPILEMTQLHGVTVNPMTIARQLEITRMEAAAALERLERLGLLRKTEDGRYEKLHDNNIAQSPHKNEALRNFHRKLLQKAIESLETQSPEEKWIGSETVAIDPKQLPEAYEIIEEFMNKMVRLFDRGKKRTRIYHMGLQLFRLSQGDQKNVTSKN